jgi:hypothetical protein
VLGGSFEDIYRDSARVVLILHQRLWLRDAASEGDEAPLRARVHAHPDSVRVVALDDTPVPEWLAAVAQCTLSGTGLPAAAEFALEAVTARGGSLRRLTPAPDAPTGEHRWGDAPPPYLSQPRSQSSLRRELDALETALGSCVGAKPEPNKNRGPQMHSSPRRLVVQLGDIGLSFSWVAGRTDHVSDGRLLVIEWDGVVASRRGMGSAQTATARRERVYRAEATGPDNWRWRADDESGEAYSSAHLAGQWASAALIAAEDLACRVDAAVL